MRSRCACTTTKRSVSTLESIECLGELAVCIGVEADDNADERRWPDENEKERGEEKGEEKENGGKRNGKSDDGDGRKKSGRKSGEERRIESEKGGKSENAGKGESAREGENAENVNGGKAGKALIEKCSHAVAGRRSNLGIIEIR